MYTVALVCIRESAGFLSSDRATAGKKKNQKIYLKKEDFEAHAIASIFVFYPSRRVYVGCRGSDS